MNRAEAVPGRAAGAEPDAQDGIAARLFSRRAAAMLVRNTVVSCLVFGLSIALLWLFVEYLHMDEVLAAAVGFLVANSVHYALGRAWIFRGTDRALAKGYVYFLASAGVGLAVTVGLYAALLRFTPMDYLVARIVVSVFAGLIMFALNALFNFRRL